MNPQWQPSGQGRHVPGSRGKMPAYNPTTREHFYIIGIAYRWTPETTFLDQENEVMISPPGCYYCQQFYAEETAAKPCPGTPPKP